MIRICAKCGKPFAFMDIKVRVPGQFDRHQTYCRGYGEWKPPTWEDLRA